MTHKVLVTAAFASALFFVAGVSSAQTAPADSPAWLRDRKYTEGIGIRTGDFELHPGVAGEIGYDSNWLLRSNRSACVEPSTAIAPAMPGAAQVCDNGPPIVPALEFRITPSLSLSTLGPQRREGDIAPVHPTVAFRMGINATWRAFIGLSSDSTGALDVSKQTEGLPSVGADARLTILPGEPVGGAVFANWVRSQLPNQTNADPNLSFDHDDVGGGGELAFQPNSGTLDSHIGYMYNTTLFESSQAQGLSNGTHEAFLRERWRFRPRTALLYDANIRFISYNNPTGAAEQGLVGSTPIRMRFGMNGLVTNRLAVMLLAGWASSLYDTGPNPAMAQQQYDSFVGQAELTWFLAPGPGIAENPAVGLALSAITLGYNRDFSNSYIGNYYGTDRGYLRFNYFFGGRALVTLEGGIAAIEYPDMYWLPPAVMSPALRHTKFTDYRADATLFGEYRFSDTTGINATIRYTSNISNVHDMPDQLPGNGTGVFDMAWNRLEAFLGFRWFM
jgi:hypothetical protein